MSDRHPYAPWREQHKLVSPGHREFYAHFEHPDENGGKGVLVASITSVEMRGAAGEALVAETLARWAQEYRDRGCTFALDSDA